MVSTSHADRSRTHRWGSGYRGALALEIAPAHQLYGWFQYYSRFSATTRAGCRMGIRVPSRVGNFGIIHSSRIEAKSKNGSGSEAYSAKGLEGNERRLKAIMERWWNQLIPLEKKPEARAEGCIFKECNHPGPGWAAALQHIEPVWFLPSIFGHSTGLFGFPGGFQLSY